MLKSMSTSNCKRTCIYVFEHKGARDSCEGSACDCKEISYNSLPVPLLPFGDSPSRPSQSFRCHMHTLFRPSVRKDRWWVMKTWCVVLYRQERLCADNPYLGDMDRISQRPNDKSRSTHAQCDAQRHPFGTTALWLAIL